MQTDVELKLRLAGIKVLSREERYKTLGSPWLYLNINTITHPSGDLFSWNVSLHLGQEVYLCTKKDTMTSTATWRQSLAGYARGSRLKEELRSITKDLVDMFLNDYLAVNPKQVDKPKKK